MTGAKRLDFLCVAGVQSFVRSLGKWGLRQVNLNLGRARQRRRKRHGTCGPEGSDFGNLRKICAIRMCHMCKYHPLADNQRRAGALPFLGVPIR